MYMIGKFNLDNLRDDQLRFISNFSLILSDIKPTKHYVTRPKINYQ